MLELRTPVGLRWRDLDVLGHLNQAVYHELLEEGRVALFGALAPEEAVGFVLARVELDYRHEIRRADERVDVVMRVASVGTSSFVLEHEILLPDGTPAAAGRSVLVAWDRETRRPRPLSAAQRRALGADG